MKSVVITGGNRGIGRSITESFLAAGYTVVVGARSSQGVEELDPKRVIFHAMDVRDEAAHHALAQQAISATGQLNAWVNNAGISAWKPIGEINDEFFDELMGINLKGAFWGCKAAAEHMAPDGGGIVNISSIAGKRGSAKNAMYCATKFGMNGLTQSLAKELGPQGIRVNALCPVLIKTDGLMEALMTDHSPANGDPELFLAYFLKANSATGTLPTGKDVGDMAVYLAAKENHAITGQCINVDCGVFPQ
ncbi:MAG: SDR family oxidoreductase [Alphaproteobacteria bacterium]|nr:SDR family oxidoreductase [Alphaproteobacteria bacterium]